MLPDEQATPEHGGVASEVARGARKPALQLRSVVKTFGEITALSGVDLDVAEGTTTVLLGPSGSGKSTLLRCINLLERPDSGTLDVGDGPIDLSPQMSRKQISRVRQRSSMVFQQFNLFPHLTAAQNVALAPVHAGGVSKPEARERAGKLLARVGLEDKAHAYPEQLSGGQQQRVAIARALAMEPRFLLFDEPTSALDPELASEVVAVLADLAADNQTLVVVTHSLAFAESVADQIVFLEGGHVLHRGTPDSFFSSTDERLTRFRAVIGAV